MEMEPEMELELESIFGLKIKPTEDFRHDGWTELYSCCTSCTSVEALQPRTRQNVVILRRHGAFYKGSRKSQLVLAFFVHQLLLPLS